jgi:hypothetical protein
VAPAPFDQLRRIVMEDPALMRELTAAPTQADLFARVIALGRQRGLHLTIAELEEIVRANRRSWLERWLL